MGYYEKQVWISTGSGQSRRQRAGGLYRSYVPTLLAVRDLSLDADVVADVAYAESQIRLFNANAIHLTETEGMARLLLRAEAVSSSHIEGLAIGPRRLLRAEMSYQGRRAAKADAASVAIIGNIHAMEDALEAAASGDVVTVETFKEMHRKLCAGTPMEDYGGIVRDKQNWVGGSSYNPLSAEYVPPAPEHVPELLDDLAAFCNWEEISPVEQAAVAHAQFETIHPFIDGNGRTGRALIHLILRRRGVAPRFVPPISLALATHSEDYTADLVSFRCDDADGDESARKGLNDWVSTFSGCCSQACDDADAFEAQIDELKEGWMKDAGPFRRDSIAAEVADAIVAMPMFTVSSLSEALQRSYSSVNAVVEALASIGAVKQSGGGARNRVFEAPEVINEFNKLERRLASPAGDTRADPPARPVPENLARAAKRRGARG